jgi:chromosome segregation ATPase
MHNIQIFHDELQQQLKILDEEFDISDLNSYMRQIMQYMQDLRQNISASETLVVLAQQIDSEEHYLEQFSAQIDMLSYGELEQALEKVLDRCDRLADQLDNWEAKGISMDDLIKRYERLTREVENIQDQLDERRDLVTT